MQKHPQRADHMQQNIITLQRGSLAAPRIALARKEMRSSRSAPGDTRIAAMCSATNAAKNCCTIPCCSPQDIEKLARLVHLRGCAEMEKTTDRTFAARRIILFREVIASGLDVLLACAGDSTDSL